MSDRREFLDRSAHACLGLALPGGLALQGRTGGTGDPDPVPDRSPQERQRILIIGMTGSEHPTRANFTYAWGAALAEAGHDVRIQLVGDAPVLVRDEVLENTAAVGWAPLRGLFDRVLEAGVPLFL